MQVSVEAKAGLERCVTVSVPAGRIETQVDERIRSLATRAKVHGFRPGKVPLAVVRQQFGAEVRQEVLGQVIQSSFYEAVSQHQLRPAGGPRIETRQAEPGQDLVYAATFEVYPDVTVGDLAQLKVVRPLATVGEADIDRVIENLRRQRAEWDPVARPAQQGDRVNMNFLGSIGGVPFPGGEGKSVPVEIGSGRFITGFEDHLVGLAKGAKHAFDITFPADYFAKDLAGKQARFEVEVLDVAQQRLPVVDDAFAEDFKVEGGVAGLRADVRANMTRELEQALKARTKDRVLEALLAANAVEVPNALVEEETDNLREQAGRQMGHAGGGLAREMFRDQAVRRVRLALILNEVKRALGIQVDRERVERTIHDAASVYERPDDVIQWYHAEAGRMAQVEAAVLEDQIIEAILAKAQVSDETLGFDAVMGPAARG